MRALLGWHSSGGVELLVGETMAGVDAFGWVLAAIVILGNLMLVVRALRRRMQLAARIDWGDPTLLDDPSVRIETITDAPSGTTILPHPVAVPDNPGTSSGDSG